MQYAVCIEIPPKVFSNFWGYFNFGAYFSIVGPNVLFEQAFLFI